MSGFSLSSLSSLWSADRYQNIGRLIDAHQGSVNAVALTANCKYIASGGSDGVKVWDVHTQTEFVPPRQGQGIRGPVSCVMWIPQREPSKEILCYGTGLGYLAFWRQGEQRRFEELFARRVGTGSEIMAMACDSSAPNSTRIVIGTRDRVVQVHRLDSHAQLHPIFSVQLSVAIPKSVAFVDNTAKDVYVFGCYNGQIHVLRGDDGRIISTQETEKLLASVAVSVRKNQFVVDNVADGFDLHQLDNGTYVRTFFTGTAQKTYPKQVVFGEEAKVVVGGSDHGAIYVFDRRTGEQLQVLRHAEKGMVQTITTREVDNVSMIVGATSGNCGKAVISLWVHKITREKRTRDPPLTWTTFLVATIQIALLLAASGFVYQNLEFGRWPAVVPATFQAPASPGPKFGTNDPPEIKTEREVQMKGGKDARESGSIAQVTKKIKSDDAAETTLASLKDIQDTRSDMDSLKLLVEQMIQSAGWPRGREARDRRTVSTENVAVIRL